LNHQLHKLGKIDGLEGEIGGGSREKEERKSFSQNLERERRRKYEDFGPKITYILPCAKVLKCPSS
jgi:hypothetical protein